MSEVITEVRDTAGLITLNRPRALNALSLDMIRALTVTLLARAEDSGVELAGSEGKQQWLNRHRTNRCRRNDVKERSYMPLVKVNWEPVGKGATIQQFFTTPERRFAINMAPWLTKFRPPFPRGANLANASA